MSTHLNARHWDYIVCKRAFKATLKKSMSSWAKRDTNTQKSWLTVLSIKKRYKNPEEQMVWGPKHSLKIMEQFPHGCEILSWNLKKNRN